MTIENTTTSEEVKNAITVLEKGLEKGAGSEWEVMRLFEIMRQLTCSPVLNDEYRKAIYASTTATFLDGMKFALGLIGAADIKDTTIAAFLSIELHRACLFNSEIFTDKSVEGRIKSE